MKLFKISIIMAVILALSAIPQFYFFFKDISIYKPLYQYVYVGYFIIMILIIAGAIISLKFKNNIGCYIVFGCLILASYGWIEGGYNFGYPLKYTFKFNQYSDKTFMDGYFFHIPFIILIIIIARSFSSLQETQNDDKKSEQNDEVNRI